MKNLLIVATLSITVAAVIKRVAGENVHDILVTDQNDELILDVKGNSVIHKSDLKVFVDGKQLI